MFIDWIKNDGWIYITVTFGIVIFICVLTFLQFIWVSKWRQLAEGKRKKTLQVVLVITGIISFIGILVGGFIMDDYHMWVGELFFPTKIDPSEREKGEKHSKVTKILVVIIIFIAIVTCIGLFSWTWI
ncbi:hypothetical protein [Spiroplasma culicicola]|uniref:Transmembrane protein n=1 Tax=Spiroplasma culicicola AES-1 TaxID=1276246 RepID=W6A866_9MOLU|nr:hypothetical protein [Spiroplasma culicicola]AHI53171.1 hypothetical protein SCULI_v1c08310 [Spiroplasma culicicola AES-1]